jgi:uncharacterized glyoxalase superfamily protein PhnB
MLSNRSMPRSTVIPEIPYPDVIEATKWLCDAFGFTLRIGMGSHRAQLNVGDGAVVLTDDRADQAEGESRAVGSSTQPLQDRACSIMVRVEDVDLHYERAKEFGARILREPANFPYGERQYSAEDFAGHRWDFSQSIADIDPKDWGGIPGQL